MISSDGGQSDGYPSLPGLLRVLNRRRYMIAVPLAAGVTLGLFSYSNAPQRFVSEAVLALDVRRVQALPTESVVSPLPQDSPVLRTELDLISSRLMAEKVIERLERQGLAIRVEESQGWFRAAMIETAMGLFEAVADPAPSEATGERPDSERVKIDGLLRNLGVSNDGRSYTIYISFRASDPAYAAQIANAYAQTYLDHQIEVKREATRRVSDWLGEKLVSLRAELEASERAAEKFRQEAGLVEMDGVIMQAQRVGSLNEELVATRAELAAAQARLDTVRALAREDAVPASTDIFSSATIQSLRADQARLERRIDQLRITGALKSSQLAGLDAEMASLSEQIRREVDQIIQSLGNEVAISRRKEASLEKALQMAQADLAAANHADVQMAQLEREAAANRTIYESYLVRYKQTIEQDGIAAPEAQVISFAEPAMARSSPRLSSWLLFGLGIGGSVALAGTVFREATDRRPKLPELLERMTGIPVIGTLPKLSGLARWKPGNHAGNPASPFGRAFSNLRSEIGLVPGQKPTTIALVSAFQEEGKTTLALGIARSAAAAGIKTVVVDANLRSPSIERTVGRGAKAHLEALTTGPRAAQDLLQRDPHSNIYYIAAKGGAAAPDQILSGRAFKELLVELKELFDLVILDTPDLEQAMDGATVTRLVDRTFFVTRFSGVHLDEIGSAMRNLSACGRTPDGIVLNRVDSRFQAEMAERPYLPRPTAVASSAGGESRP